MTFHSAGLIANVGRMTNHIAVAGRELNKPPPSPVPCGDSQSHQLMEAVMDMCLLLGRRLALAAPTLDHLSPDRGLCGPELRISCRWCGPGQFLGGGRCQPGFLARRGPPSGPAAVGGLPAGALAARPRQPRSTFRDRAHRQPGRRRSERGRGGFGGLRDRGRVDDRGGRRTVCPRCPPQAAGEPSAAHAPSAGPEPRALSGITTSSLDS
jgi:hypothetical protein